MKKFVNEFKTFIKRGNVMDMAVGIIIGAAFKAIVDSLVNDIINPLLGLAGGMNFDQYVWNVNGAVIAYGKFITAIINFLIMAFIIFLLVRTINKMLSAGKKEEPKPFTTKKCPYCLSDIALEATRCPHCKSVLEEKKEEV